MQKVYTCDNLMQAGLVKSLLEEQGIKCLMKNESLTGGIGELPPIECWPEVWIRNDADHPLASRIIASMNSEAATGRERWLCVCGETLDGQFSHCWNCGHEHTGI
ncbi:MAG: DUF2007 domain-containing protein [Thiotrichales bacterium]|nr:DUF2007 domain-containing protein [Thiotrichales bacterium]